VYVAVQIAYANGPSDATQSDEAQAEELRLAESIPTEPCSKASCGPRALLDFPSKQRKQAP
jgi:hypothetical protein